MKEDESETEGSINVSFSVTTQFDLIVRDYEFGLWGPNSERFPLSAPEAFEQIKRRPFSQGEMHTNEISVERDISVEARITAEGEQYKDLTIKRVFTY